MKKLLLQCLRLFLKISNHAALLLPHVKQTDDQRKRVGIRLLSSRLDIKFLPFPPLSRPIYPARWYVNIIFNLAVWGSVRNVCRVRILILFIAELLNSDNSF